MAKILEQDAQIGEDQLERWWSDPELIDEACIRAMDDLFGHDVERLASLCGIERRELNKQRERRADLFGRRWLYRIALVSRFAFMKFGRERTAGVARIIARACGYTLAEPANPAVRLGEPAAVLQQIAEALTEASDAAAKLSAATLVGIHRHNANGLISEVDEAIEKFEAIRVMLQNRIADSAEHDLSQFKSRRSTKTA